MLEIYTDGSCLGNPGPGGWGVISRDFKLTGGSRESTNNIMEMTAIIRGLEHIKKCGINEVCIFTDSNYTKNGITSWIKNWKRNGWRTASGSAVKNKELWKTLDTLVQSIKIVEWRWVKAHNGNVQNELVDKLARSTAQEFQNNLNIT